MRKLVIFLFFFLISSIAHAEVKGNQLFDCMDAKSFEVNSQCVEAKISQNIHFREMQLDIAKSISQSDKNVLATAKFYPKQMRVEIVAHKDALYADDLVAANTAEK